MRRQPTPYHTFNHWPVFLVLAVVFAVGSGQTIVIGYELHDPGFMAVFGIGFAVNAVAFAALAINTRRYKLKWAPIIAEDRRRCEESS